MNGQLTLFDLTRPMVKVNKPIRLIELFAGYGSQSMALRNIGADYEPWRVIEIDKYAMASYNAVHGTAFETSDIRKIGGGTLGIVEKDKYTYIMTYSWPCTDVSLAGQQLGMEEGSGTRSSLLWEVKRILTELNEIDALPQILVFENVTAIHNEKNKTELVRFLSFLDELKYSTFISDLNAWDYGVAQSRDRCFGVSILGEYNYKFPEPIDLKYCIEDYYEDLTEEQALQLVVKSQKALELLERLDGEGKLEKERERPEIIEKKLDGIILKHEDIYDE